MDAGAQGTQHRPGEPGAPSVPEQVVLVVEGAGRVRGRQRLRGRSGVQLGELRAEYDTDPLRLHRLRQEIQMARQPQEAPEGGLRQQGEKVLLSRVRPKVQVSIRITESHHRASRRVIRFLVKEKFCPFVSSRIKRT